VLFERGVILFWIIPLCLAYLFFFYLHFLLNNYKINIHSIEEDFAVKKIELERYNDALQIIKNGLSSNPGNQDIFNLKERIITKIEES